jgi:hypothetical protein
MFISAFILTICVSYPVEGPLFFCSTKNVQLKLFALHFVQGNLSSASHRVFFFRHMSQLRLALVLFDLPMSAVFGNTKVLEGAIGTMFTFWVEFIY